MWTNWIIYSPESILATLATLISTWYAIARIGIRPEVSVSVNDDLTSITCEKGKSISLNIEFENKGGGGTRRFPIRKDTLHEIAIAIYFPPYYTVTKIERQNATQCNIFHAPQKGKYAGLHYVYVPDPFDRKPPVMSSLRYKEVEECHLVLERTPSSILPDDTEIKFDVTSREGGIRANSIKILKK